MMLRRSFIVLMGLMNLVHIPLTWAMEDLSGSMMINYQQAILDAYDDAFKQWSSDKRQPFIFYIAKNNNSYSWLSLVNLAIDKHQLNSHDLMWIIDEYVYSYVLSKEKSAHMFKIAISDQLKNPKRSKYVVDLITLLSIEKKSGWLTQYSLGETYNILVEIIEKSYNNIDYLKVFRQIIEDLPAEMLNSYLCAKRIENKVEVSYNLLKWLNRPAVWVKCSYLEKSRYQRSYYVIAAKHVIDYRLSQPALLHDKDLDEAMVNLITLLYKQNDLGQEQFNQASARFSLVKTNT